MAPLEDTRSTAELFSDALAQLTHLIRTEVDLARAEVMVKLNKALVGVGLIGAAALLVIPALVLLLIAVAAELTRLGLAEPLSDLLAAIIGFALAAIFGVIGLNRLKADNLMPDRAIRQVKRDIMAAKDQAR